MIIIKIIEILFFIGLISAYLRRDGVKIVINPFINFYIFWFLYCFLGTFFVAYTANSAFDISTSAEQVQTYNLVICYQFLIYTIIGFLIYKINGNLNAIVWNEDILSKIIILYFLLSIIFDFYLIYDNFDMVNLGLNRFEMHTQYLELVEKKFYFDKKHILDVIISVLYVFKRKKILIPVTVLYMGGLIPLLFGSRNYIFSAIVANIIFLILSDKFSNKIKNIISVMLLCFIFILSSIYFWLSYDFNMPIEAILYMIFAEIANTSIASVVIVGRNISNSYEIVSWVSQFLFKPFTFLFDSNFEYALHKINDNYIGASYSLSGNMIAVTMYYLGIWGAIFEPIIVSILLISIILLSKRSYIISIISILICIDMRVMIRGDFYSGLFGWAWYSLIFCTLFYLMRTLIRNIKMDKRVVRN